MTKAEKARRIAHIVAIETWGLGSRAVDNSGNRNAREMDWCQFINPESVVVGRGRTWDEALRDVEHRAEMTKYRTYA